MPETAIADTKAAAPTRDLVVYNKFDGTALACLPQCSESEVQLELIRAASATGAAAAMPRHERGRILDTAAGLLRERSHEVAELIVAEAGKTIKQAAKEVSRAVNTLKLSAAETRRNVGEVVPFDSFAGSENRQGWFTREPLGLIAAITPYNDPLNLVAHKLGPAIASGNTVILKPSQLTPLTAILLVDLLREAGLPAEFVTVVLGDRSIAQTMVSSKLVRMVSFTGGFATGRAISASAGLKRLSMELGGNAPVIVFDDAHLPAAVEASVSGSFWAAGQNCIGAQRILVQRTVFEAFLQDFVTKTSALKTGDPRSEQTDVGPMISNASAAEAKRKIDDAVAAGAQLLTGGTLDGPLLTPAVLTGVPRSCEAWSEELFAPVVLVEPFDTAEEAIELANDTEYALQAGVFTKDLGRALAMAKAIDAGGVMINDSSDYRHDAMPFGGSKYGSMGREGVHFAYEEMTQPKVVAIAS
ncbi:aldehyde dehydrogenase family protein [Paenarthrobacter aurescens]|uniref:Aldehyde dehydrogenase n=1 Tax=Paenarthrobacter aurescens TaxID=43663 RepID=A0A4Y3N8R7_PAEAU|nr:aldehyde dehydrogenase family protein [Paenarthrobacter aurescens]MDO6143402.1 aldehyde dehydrogenase family protein [Paenarthrobacter aurescens]MDO6147250.1 aldehyde dehydrogenase family protein [Paenarthrobacter aurescens]MDO6158494.1 aldehyde dehydrogenase family protein [Paenarthrobacter aurescens]MDO6162477.1 aldehyde dehydrogenase family protein [Paenarthrobacter aurescens]GEB18220.1 aldehyde dehydrogenase [Paenarthrobacter aurescens]